ncbi:MAG: peptidase U32 family protein, partial [Blautia faecis]
KEYGKGEFCPLSLKDICTIEILPEIIEAGVTSLKIEGRMKQPAYTAGVTGMYRKYLDFLFEKGPANYHVTEKDKKYLLDLFNRGGSCTGYYQMGNGPQMMAFTNEKKQGKFSWKRSS